MTNEDKLKLLKQDLQMLTSSNDDFLSSLLSASETAIQREGIALVENDMDIDMAVIQYAAYLFRNGDAAIPAVAAEQHPVLAERESRWRQRLMMEFS